MNSSQRPRPRPRPHPHPHPHPSRREMLIASAAVAASACFACAGASPETQPGPAPATAPAPGAEPIIDIHQHTTYLGRSLEALLHHQKRMGVSQTILLPSGSPVDAPSTLKGKANGLYAGAGGIDTVVPVAEAHPREYFYFANEVPDLPDATKTIEKFLKQGALGIGEQKFNLPCDSKEMEAIYALAQEYNVPVLMHFQYEMFNTGFERLGDVLTKWPRVTFIAHAQAFWANIDANAVKNPKDNYPKGKVTPGGLSDRYLSDHANFYGDLSAGSGLNALVRDEDHGRAFLERHKDKLMFGSDCADRAGFGPTCSGSQMIAAIRRLSPDRAVERKLLHDNAAKMFGI